MNNKIEYIGKEDLTERELFFLSLDSSIDIPQNIQLTSKNFACLIAWDSKNNSNQEISDFAETLIKNGAAYICIWGNDSKRIEDICDNIDSNPNNQFGSLEGSVIMTTSHRNESIEDTLYYFLTDTHPDEYYEATLKSSLAIAIGNKDKLKIIEDALSNPNLFRKNILDKEEGFI